MRSGEPLACIYSGQYGAIRAGDTIWILGPLKDRFVTIGYVRVARTQQRADGKIDAVAADPVLPKVVDLSEDWESALQFENQRSRIERAQDGLPDGRQLQRVRRLAIGSQKWLERRWKEVT